VKTLSHLETFTETLVERSVNASFASRTIVFGNLFCAAPQIKTHRRRGATPPPSGTPTGGGTTAISKFRTNCQKLSKVDAILAVTFDAILNLTPVPSTMFA
jgi:hypothetical protein